MVDVELAKLLSDFEYLTGSGWVVNLDTNGRGGLRVRLTEKVGRGREEFPDLESLTRHLRREVNGH